MGKSTVIAHKSLHTFISRLNLLAAFLKWPPSEDVSGPEKVDNAQVFSFAGFDVGSVSIYAIGFFFFFFCFSMGFSGCSHVGLLFTNEEQEKVGL